MWSFVNPRRRAGPNQGTRMFTGRSRQRGRVEERSEDGGIVVKGRVGEEQLSVAFEVHELLRQQERGLVEAAAIALGVHQRLLTPALLPPVAHRLAPSSLPRVLTVGRAIVEQH